MKIKPNLFKFYAITILLIWSMMSANLLLGAPKTTEDIIFYLVGSIVLLATIPLLGSHVEPPKKP